MGIGDRNVGASSASGSLYLGHLPIFSTSPVAQFAFLTSLQLLVLAFQGKLFKCGDGQEDEEV